MPSIPAAATVAPELIDMACPPHVRGLKAESVAIRTMAANPNKCLFFPFPAGISHEKFAQRIRRAVYGRTADKSNNGKPTKSFSVRVPITVGSLTGVGVWRLS